MEQKVTIDIGAFFTDTRMKRCMADKCTFHNLDWTCKLKETSVNEHGDCEQYNEPKVR
jgi:hypothetical protein